MFKEWVILFITSNIWMYYMYLGIVFTQLLIIYSVFCKDIVSVCWVLVNNLDRCVCTFKTCYSWFSQDKDFKLLCLYFSLWNFCVLKMWLYSIKDLCLNLWTASAVPLLLRYAKHSKGDNLEHQGIWDNRSVICISLFKCFLFPFLGIISVY